MPFNITADENIPLVREAFSHLGTVTTLTGRHLQPRDLKKTDILLVRSVTPVNRNLLADSPVRFVGTATIGLDHIDRAYLEEAGIRFAYAPGSNAESAAEYVLSALVTVTEAKDIALQDLTVGIIGCGNVGSRLLSKLEALGVRCLVNDPPLQARDPNGRRYTELAKLLAVADVVSLHVPLEKHGPWPTWRLADADFFAALKNNSAFINTSRGQVTDETALRHKLAESPRFCAILDVWNNEPHIDTALLAHVKLGTSHVAGYSLDGKVRGTAMLYQAVCEYFGLSAWWRMAQALPPPPLQSLQFSATATDIDIIRTAVRACYDVRRDDAALRRLPHMPDRAAYFDKLRKHYPVHREFDQIQIKVPPGREVVKTQLAGLGFQVVSS